MYKNAQNRESMILVSDFISPCLSGYNAFLKASVEILQNNHPTM